jgi:hypothetical protein
MKYYLRAVLRGVYLLVCNGIEKNREVALPVYLGVSGESKDILRRNM